MATNTPPDLLADSQPSPSPLSIPATITETQLSESSSVSTEISVESVCRYFGGPKYKPNAKTIERIRSCIDAASDLVTPKVTYTLFPVSNITPGKEITLENGLKLMLPDCFTDQGTQVVAAIIETLGAQLEKHCRDLAAQGSVYESTLFDAIGTVMLDQLSENVSGIIAKVGQQYKLGRGPRFSPGIDSYPLEQQHVLFQMADNESIEVTLNSSVIMTPTKSISFFLMLTTTIHESETTHKCNHCRLAKCQFRMVT